MSKQTENTETISNDNKDHVSLKRLLYAPDGIYYTPNSVIDKIPTEVYAEYLIGLIGKREIDSKIIVE